MFRSRAQWGNVFLRGEKAPVLRRLFPACGGLVSSHGVPILYSCVPVPLVIDWFRLMGRIDEDSIRRVLEATDIVDVVGSYLPLKRAGSRWKACCPFHNEKTPSFIVDQSRQNFKCFGCGEGGSAITFVMKMENLGFADTVRRLAEKAGISIVEEVYDAAGGKAAQGTHGFVGGPQEGGWVFPQAPALFPEGGGGQGLPEFPRIRGRHGETLAGRVGS